MSSDEDGRRLRPSTRSGRLNAARRAESGRPTLLVSVADGAGRPVRIAGLANWLARVAPGRARGAVTVALVSDRRIRVLNRQYRRIDRATDVLSFPTSRRRARLRRRQAGPQAKRGHVLFLGDVVIATGVAGRQAREAGHSLATEYRILALHGLLHLLGYDHERDSGRMARVERTLRCRGGLDGGLIERAGVRYAEAH